MKLLTAIYIFESKDPFHYITYIILKKKGKDKILYCNGYDRNLHTVISKRWFGLNTLRNFA